MNTSSSITKIVHYSCVALSLKAVMQKIGGKGKTRKEQKEGVKTKLAKERKTQEG